MSEREDLLTHADDTPLPVIRRYMRRYRTRLPWPLGTWLAWLVYRLDAKDRELEHLRDVVTCLQRGDGGRE